jgi:hypothetical protein
MAPTAQASSADWNGTTWAIIPSPNDGSQSFLNAVSAGAEDDAWAVGSSYRGTTEYPLIAHWDGASWSLVSGGTASEELGALTGVAALAPDDVWAVGRPGTVRAHVARGLSALRRQMGGEADG